MRSMTSLIRSSSDLAILAKILVMITLSIVVKKEQAGTKNSRAVPYTGKPIWHALAIERPAQRPTPTPYRGDEQLFFVLAMPVR